VTSLPRYNALGERFFQCSSIAAIMAIGRALVAQEQPQPEYSLFFVKAARRKLHPEWVQSIWGDGANEHRRLRSYIVGTYDKDAGPNNQRLYLNGARIAQMSDTLPIDLNSAALGIGRHVSGIADPFNGLIDEFRVSHVQRSDRWIETTWNNLSDPRCVRRGGDRGAARRRAASDRGRWCRRLPDGVSESAR
jgi:Concanavalin A-like lectin/glucanases superfamily